MIKVGLAVVGIVAILGPSFVQAQEFSADAVAHNSRGNTMTMKVYVENKRIRVEPVGGPSYEIIDLDGPHGWFVKPSKKAYIVQDANSIKKNSAAYVVASNPCDNVSTPEAPAKCVKVGTDKVNNRDTEKWTITQTFMGQTGTSTVWVDRGIHSLVKSSSKFGNFELTNLKFGPQPDTLFALPAGYKEYPMATITKGAPVVPLHK